MLEAADILGEFPVELDEIPPWLRPPPAPTTYRAAMLRAGADRRGVGRPDGAYVSDAAARAATYGPEWAARVRHDSSGDDDSVFGEFR